MDTADTVKGQLTLANGLLPIASVKEVADEFHEIARPEELVFVERPSRLAHKYGQAHAFIAQVSNAQVIGSGSLVKDGKLIVHGLSTGNYRENIEKQLEKYRMVPDGGSLSGQYTLLWGDPNFGHWFITYLLRLSSLWYRPELKEIPLLVKQGIPARFMAWLWRMGFKARYAEDGVRVEKLIVPSVVCYRGHYEDKAPYVWPESAHILRESLLGDKRWRSGTKRIYLSRSRAQWRKLVNEDEVAELLEKHGITRVFLEDMSVDEQLDLVSQCELIVVHFGAASTITMMAPVSCRIIEIAGPNIVGTFASRCWAHILGQKFTRINAKPISQTGRLVTDWDAELDVAELKPAL